MEEHREGSVLTYERHSQWPSPLRGQAKVLRTIGRGLMLVAALMVPWFVWEMCRAPEASWAPHFHLADRSIVPAVTAIACVFLGISFFASARIPLTAARLADEQFRQFEGGKFMVHWKYPQPQWEAFVRRDSGRSLAKAALWFILVPLGLLFGWAAGTGKGAHDRALADPVGGAFVGFGLAATAALVFFALTWWGIASGRKARLAAGGEAWVARAGAYCSGRFTPLAPPYRLTAAKFDPGAMELVLKTYRPGGRNGYRATHRLPVPEGGAEIAVRVVHALRTAHGVE